MSFYRAPPLTQVPDFRALPALNRLPSRPFASFLLGDSIFEIGWTGNSWVQCFKGVRPSANYEPYDEWRAKGFARKEAIDRGGQLWDYEVRPEDQFGAEEA